MSDSAYTGLSLLMSAGGCIIGLLSLALGIVIFWKIFAKAGYSGAMSLLMLIPIANIIMLCILAFGRWPIYEELDQLRAMRGNYPPQGGYPPQPPYPTPYR